MKQTKKKKKIDTEEVHNIWLQIFVGGKHDQNDRPYQDINSSNLYIEQKLLLYF